MGDATCTEAGCVSNGTWGAGLCGIHYKRRSRRGLLPPKQLELRLDSHSLSGVDSTARTANCSLCGPNVRVRVRGPRPGRGGSVECQGPRKLKARRLADKYGITVDDYDRLLDAQQGACAICGATGKKLCVDHCHSTGRVRGLLCHTCNSGIGYLRDDPELLRGALRYLEGD